MQVIECRPNEVYFAQYNNSLGAPVNHTCKIVNVITGSCTCGEWQRDHIPCAHALAVSNALSKSVWEYINESYFASKYKSVYNHQVNPAAPIDMSLDQSIEAPSSVLQRIAETTEVDA